MKIIFMMKWNLKLIVIEKQIQKVLLLEQIEEESFDNESDDDFDDFTNINIIDGMFKISFNIYI